MEEGIGITHFLFPHVRVDVLGNSEMLCWGREHPYDQDIDGETGGF